MGSLNVPGVGSTIERRVDAIDAEVLTPVVREVLDDERATVGEWTRTALRGGVGGGYFGTALFRFDGTTTAESNCTEWSVVLKILAERPDEDPFGHPYWKREVEVYRSNLVREVPGELVPSRTYRIDEYPGESVWLWLEVLEDAYGGEWPLEQYHRAANHLGQFNGAFLAERDLPSAPWVVERTFDFSKTAGTVALVDRVPDDPIVRRHFPTAEDRERLFAAWHEHGRFVNARSVLPKTFCHFDPFGRNLFATTAEDGTARTVAIDWDQCGIGRIGDDAGALVILSLIFLDWPTSRVTELERTVLEGYSKGIAAAGWEGPTDLVVRGYRLHIVNRWLEWVGRSVRNTVDERTHGWLSQMVGDPIDTLLDGNRDIHRFAFETIDKLGLDAPDDAEY